MRPYPTGCGAGVTDPRCPARAVTGARSATERLRSRGRCSVARVLFAHAVVHRALGSSLTRSLFPHAGALRSRGGNRMRGSEQHARGLACMCTRWRMHARERTACAKAGGLARGRNTEAAVRTSPPPQHGGGSPHQPAPAPRRRQSAPARPRTTEAAVRTSPPPHHGGGSPHQPAPATRTQRLRPRPPRPGSSRRGARRAGGRRGRAASGAACPPRTRSGRHRASAVPGPRTRRHPRRCPA